MALVQENTRQLGKIRVPTSEYFVSIIRTSHYLFHNTAGAALLKAESVKQILPSSYNLVLEGRGSTFINK